jgi:hypothetical protein
MVFAVLPGHSADRAVAQPPKTYDELVKEARESAEARVAERVREFGLTNLVPVKRPEVLVKTEQLDGKEIVHSIVTKENGAMRVRVLGTNAIPENPEEYQPGALKKITRPTDTYRDFHVFVVTSTDLTNWYPVSYGEKYPESKQPRYFKLWTEVDRTETMSSIETLMERSSGAQLERLKKLKQAAEGSK